MARPGTRVSAIGLRDKLVMSIYGGDVIQPDLATVSEGARKRPDRRQTHSTTGRIEVREREAFVAVSVLNVVDLRVKDNGVDVIAWRRSPDLVPFSQRYGCRQRPDAPVQQTIEVGVRASVDKTRSRPPPRRPSLV